MSHEITNIDKQQGRTMAWHGLTEVIPDLSLSSCFLRDWDVAKRRLNRTVPDQTAISDGIPPELVPLIQEPTDYCELVCTDDPAVTIKAPPVHCETYNVLTNADFLNTVSDALSSIAGGATVESVGSVCGRGRIFVAAKIADLGELRVAGRVFHPYLNFLSSHDQSCAFTVNASIICTVCNNTFGMNLHDDGNKGFRVYLKHTRNQPLRLANIPALVQAFHCTALRFSEVMRRFSETGIGSGVAEKFFAGFLCDGDLLVDEGMSSRRQHQIARLMELFVSGKGNDGQTYADLFGAITDYYTHESAGDSENNPWKQVASSEFGAGQTAKLHAWNVLQDIDQFNSYVKAGDHALVLTAAL